MLSSAELSHGRQLLILVVTLSEGKQQLKDSKEGEEDKTGSQREEEEGIMDGQMRTD